MTEQKSQSEGSKAGPLSLSESLRKRILEENASAAERRHKLDLQKILFVTAMLGIGGLKIEGATSFGSILYIAPLIAVSFDLMVMGQHFVIKRNNAFLRCVSSDQDGDIVAYTAFLAAHRDRIFRIGSRGFTGVAIAAGPFLLYEKNGALVAKDWIWYALLLVVYIAIVVFSFRSGKNLDNLTSINGK